MSVAAIVEIACIVLAFVCVCLLAECRVSFANERVDKIVAQEHRDRWQRRALDAEEIIRAAGSPQFERHVDQALEQAEPSPDIRRVK